MQGLERFEKVRRRFASSLWVCCIASCNGQLICALVLPRCSADLGLDRVLDAARVDMDDVCGRLMLVMHVDILAFCRMRV